VTAVGGIRFGTFTLFRRLARGGMAEVFLARQTGLEGFDRRVAVKRILPHLADSNEFIAMFLREARLAARLSHPNIVHIYDFGKVGSDYFIAMEFVDGVTAGELISSCASDPMPAVLVARLGADAATALHYAHELRGENGKVLGLVHRDVSPANLMVSFDGVVKLVDFGIAKAAEVTDDKTNPGTVKGKYAYMSPEQTIAGKLDGRSDVFSLAIVLWELLAGRPIVERGDRVAAMRAIRDGRLPPLVRVAPSTPPALVEAITWALARRREDRATASQLAQALEAFIKVSPELATSMHLAAWVRQRFKPITDTGAPILHNTAVAHSSSAEPAGTQVALSEEDLAATIPMHRITAAEIFGGQQRSALAARPPPRGPSPREMQPAGPIALATEAIVALPVERHVATTTGAAPARPHLYGPRADPAPMVTPVPIATTVHTPAVAATASGDLVPRKSVHRRLLVIALAVATVASAFAVTLFVMQPRSKKTGASQTGLIATPLPVDAGDLARSDAGVPSADDAGSRDDAGRPGDAGRGIADAGPDSSDDAKVAAEPEPSINAPNPPDQAPQRRPGERRPLAARNRLATLDIIAVPADAVIAIGNLPPQRSPARFSLPAGAHRLRVAKPGYEEVRRAVDLVEGQRRTIELRLLRAVNPDDTVAASVGHLSVQTNPASSVFLGARSLGPTPVIDAEILPGTYTLTFKRPGRDTVARKLTLRPGENLKLTFDLP
jgi:serine/threonine protein kinase